ncbi:MAG: crotonase/enoyl-CoA hydratase family protein [Acidimicrobiales bacterium]
MNDSASTEDDGSSRVTVSIDAGVADVRLNRPSKLNAVDPAMFAALVDTGAALQADRSVRAIVLSGEGRGFCAGLDLSSFSAMAGRDRAPSDSATTDDRDPAAVGPSTILDRGDRITSLGQQAAYTWTEQPAPVIAAITGPALGAGLQIALAADIRFIAPDATMSVLEIRWGLVPDMTGTQMLPRLVGLDVAKELAFTGRMVDGRECVELGLATHLSDDPKGAAMELATEIAAKSPHAIRGAKRLVNMAGQVPLAEGFAAEAETMAELIGSPNNSEAVKAYFEQRVPDFAD